MCPFISLIRSLASQVSTFHTSEWFCTWQFVRNTVDGSEIQQTHQLRLEVYPLIYRVLYIQTVFFLGDFFQQSPRLPSPNARRTSVGYLNALGLSRGTLFVFQVLVQMVCLDGVFFLELPSSKLIKAMAGISPCFIGNTSSIQVHFPLLC